MARMHPAAAGTAAVTVTNAWRNVTFTPAEIAEPSDLDEVLAALRSARERGLAVKAVGGGHSMNNVYRTDGVLIDLRRLSGVLSVDRANQTATLAGGTTLGDAIVALHREQLHFPSLGSWHTQTIAGAIATSTHGSSLVHGSLSDIVTGAEMMLADGQVVTLADGDDLLPAVRCHLGCLGLLTKVTVRLVPAFFLSCRIETFDAPDAFETILPHADANEYVNMLWVPDLDEAYVRILTRSDATARNDKALALEEKFVGRSQLSHRFEDVGFFAAAHAYQISPARVSRWYCGKVREAFFDDNGVVDASYRVFLYDQYREPTENHSLRMIMNVEYAFDTEVLRQILRELRKLLADQRNDGRHLNYPRVHVRFAPRSDATLIGLNADRRTAYVGIYVLGSVRGKGQIPLARAIERLFVSHGGRPHWGKYSYLADSAYRRTYPAMLRFESVRRQLDPNGLFSRSGDMFAELERFERAPLRTMLRSIFAADEYSEPRIL